MDMKSWSSIKEIFCGVMDNFKEELHLTKGILNSKFIN